MAVFSWFERTQARADIFFWRLRPRSPASHSFARLDRPGRRVSRAVTSVASFAGTRVRVKSPSLVGSGLESPAGRPRSRPASSCREERGLPPSVPVARLGAIDARARTRLPNEIDMTIVDSGRESRVAAAARTAGIASASSSPGRAPEPAPRGFAAHTIGEEHFYGHMLSGALAGTTEHCAMFPLDTIKTRMQTATTSAVAGATLGDPPPCRRSRPLGGSRD